MSDQKNYWKYGLIGFWVVVLSMNSVLIYLATQNQSDLVDKDYYQNGVEFQKDIDAKKLFEEVYPNTIVKYSHKTLTVSHLGLNENSPDSARVLIYRADDPTKDKQPNLSIDFENDQFKTNTMDLAKGPYKIRIEMLKQNDFYAKDFNIWID